MYCGQVQRDGEILTMFVSVIAISSSDEFIVVGTN